MERNPAKSSRRPAESSQPRGGSMDSKWSWMSIAGTTRPGSTNPAVSASVNSAFSECSRLDAFAATSVGAVQKCGNDGCAARGGSASSVSYVTSRGGVSPTRSEEPRLAISLPDPRSLAVPTVVVALVLSACGSAGSKADSGAEPSANDVAAFCQAIVDFDAVDQPGEGGPLTKDEITGFGDALAESAATIVENAPASLADPVEVLDQTVAALQEGDGSALEDPTNDAAQAVEAIEVAGREDCDWESLDVTAAEYGFDVSPMTVGSGPVSVQMTNTGEESHVFLLIRKPDGDSRDSGTIVTETLEAFESGDPEQLGAVADRAVSGAGPFALPGQTGTHVYDLAPGTYVAWCPISQGESEDAPPHFMLGMVAEFEVA